MFFFPHRRLHFTSPLNPAQAAAALTAAIRPRFAPRSGDASPPPRRDGKFTGEIEAGQFFLIRDTETRNRLVPQVEGFISAETPGSNVFAYVSLPPFVQKYILILCVVFAVFGALAVAVSLERGPRNALEALIPFFAAALPVLCAALPWIIFLPEARKAEQFLKTTLNGK